VPEPEPEPEPAPEAATAPSAGLFATSTSDVEDTLILDRVVPDAPVEAVSAPKLDREASVLDELDTSPRPKRWPRVLVGIGTGLLVLGGAYVGAQWSVGDRVAPGTTVAGVDIGGLDADAAIAQLDSNLANATTEPIPVEVGEKRTSLDPVAAGLMFDAGATVDQITGFTFDPVRLWRQAFGGGEVTPVTTADPHTLGAAVTGVADALVIEAVDGTVVFVDNQAVATAPSDGVAVDEPAAAELLVAEWLTAPRPIELPALVTSPLIDQEAVDTALADVARPLAAAPVTVSVSGQLVELPVEVLTEAAAFVPTDDGLELQMDGELLVGAVLERTTDLLSDAADAEFTFVDDAPQITPGTPGTTLDPDMLGAAVAAAGTSGDTRTAEVELTESQPEESTEALEALGITEIVSEFDTPLTSNRIRTINIANGCSKINGMLLRPGETFSLGDALSPIDGEHGYVQAGAIINGEHTKAWGGGLSQVSTTTFNAAYFAGMEIVEHTPHSEYFRRYPEGREATIFTPTIDMKWRNNTPYGALVQAWVDSSTNRVHVRIWGTKYWTVESETSGRWDVVSPRTVYSQSPTCSPQSAGNSGFSVRVKRRVLLNGEVANEESWTTTYRPQNRVVCGSAPED
jgi:vancomycin resistance protein YoaR